MRDIIICNGLVRYIKNTCDKVTVFCKHHDYKNTVKMYSDDENIIVMAVADDSEVMNFIDNNCLHDNTIRVGFEKLFTHPESSFDISFYSILDLPFSCRFDNFYYQRDLKTETDIFNRLINNDEKYIFCHGDLDFSKIRNDLRIVKNPIEYSLFDLITIFENAEEIHLMESSIKCLINSYRLNKPKLYYHQYVRNYPEYNNTKGLNEYEIIL
jgi:hypothetical protein